MNKHSNHHVIGINMSPLYANCHL